MSASARTFSSIPDRPIISFYAECRACAQIGLFATVDGFLACDWRLDERSDEPRTTRNGLFLVQATCSRCRGQRRGGKLLLRGAK